MLIWLFHGSREHMICQLGHIQAELTEAEWYPLKSLFLLLNNNA